MEENKIIKLSDLISLCLSFKENPTEETADAIQDIINQMQIRSYLPLEQKQICLFKILMGLAKNIEANVVTWTIDTAKLEIIYGIFAYVINLDNDLELLALTDNVTDCLYELNVIDTILEYCDKDYHRFIEMVHNMINFSNISALIDQFEQLSQSNIDELTKQLAGVTSQLTPENLEKFKSILNHADPVWGAFKEAVGDDIINTVNDNIYDSINK